MGIKKFFKIKPPEEDTPEQNRETLNEMGISTKNPSKKKREKFAAYGKFAKDRMQDRGYAPEGYEDYINPQEADDLNKSELDGETANIPNEAQKGASDPYNIPAGASDPYAINTSSAYGSDPYANLQAGNNRRNGYSNNAYSAQNSSYVDPYQAGNSFDAYESYNQDHSSPGGGTGGGMRSQNRNTNVSPYVDNRANNSYSSNPTVNSATPSGNPYGNIRGVHDEYSGSGSVTRNSTPGANPYAALGADAYSGQTNQGSKNPYSTISNDPVGSRTPVNREVAARATGPPGRRSRRPQAAPANSIGLNDTQSVVDTLDLNKSPLDGEDLNEEPRTGEFDFEEDRHSGMKNTVGIDEMDFNATGEEPGASEDFNSTVADSQQQQLYQEAPQWQLEEEAGPSQSQYTQDYDRGFKTFEELQKEEEARQQQEEDEAVDEIKQEIRFTKQSSVASTRNTLKMAQEAEMSGMNSLGLLGHQSERLNNIEGNIDLLKVQNKIADDKVAELKKLNRNILAVHVSNPFNSKRRQREREEKIKNRKIEERLMREQTNKELSRSTQRIEGAMNGNNEINTVREKYQRQQILDRAKQFQFENDEEDDMMEVEIDRNLDQIQQISGRLKKLAVATGEELDSQQKRVRNIEDNTDDLDIKIHLNTTKLSGIR